MFMVSSQQVSSSRIDTQWLHSDRKGEVWDRDARFGHFLDQPDKIKIENKIQNHAKDLSSKKKTAESIALKTWRLFHGILEDFVTKVFVPARLARAHNGIQHAAECHVRRDKASKAELNQFWE